MIGCCSLPPPSLPLSDFGGPQKLRDFLQKNAATVGYVVIGLLALQLLSMLVLAFQRSALLNFDSDEEDHDAPLYEGTLDWWPTVCLGLSSNGLACVNVAAPPIRFRL